MTLVERVHGSYVFQRRVRVLSHHIARLLPTDARVLDVGCGDGKIASLIALKRPDAVMRGIDVLVRESTHIPVEEFDGQVIPYQDASFDVVLFVDVLHHTTDPVILLGEAARVARRAVVIKDHLRHGLLANATLRYMDRVGNIRYGVALTYNYWTKSQWFGAFEAVRLKPDVWMKDLPLYPRPLSWIFGRSLHFLARLEITRNLHCASSGRPVPS